ncbi:MAG: hypothetical protein ACYTKD_21730 [Planctomycetota bacterium]|jgi:hypothetical protein
MRKKLLLSGTVVAGVGALVAATVLLIPGCSVQPTLTPEMKKELGAAVWVPEDVSVYSSMRHPARQSRQIWESNAVQNLVRLPLVQMMWNQMAGSSEYQQGMAMPRGSPLVQEGLPVLKDAFSTEVFSCAGPEMVDALQALADIMNTMRLAGLEDALADRDGTSRGPEVLPLVEAILEHKDRLRMPSFLIGFKLTDEGAAKRFLDSWLPRIGPTPVGRIEKRPLGGVDFHVLELKGESIPERDMESVLRELEKERVPRNRLNELAGFIRSRRVTIAVGILDGYLMLSIGEDMSLLSRWGQGPSLAASAELEPLRARYKQGLLSIGYSSARLSSLLVWTPEEIKELLREILVEKIPEEEFPAGLKSRLLKDVDLLAEEVGVPTAGSALSFSFANRGLESYTIGPPSDGMLDFSEPLSILTHRGRGPISVLASRAAENPGGYDTLVKWVRIGFGYFEDYAVPEMFGGEERREYEKVMRLARPFLVSIDKTTRQHLIPAIDGTQSLQLIDGHGKLGKLPGGRRLAPEVPAPRLGVAVELKDPGKFVEAMGQYLAAAKTLLNGIRQAYPSQVPPGLDVPSPETEAAAGGKLLFYRLPWDMGRDVFPCALLKEELLVLASSSELAAEMAGTVPMPAGEVTAPGKAAGEVAMVDFEQCGKLLKRLTDSVFTHLQQERVIAPEDVGGAMVVRMHLDALWRSLRALRSYRSTATLVDGRVVRHSWLHVEDIEE